jgi:hypothetical protein
MKAGNATQRVALSQALLEFLLDIKSKAKTVASWVREP